ncbi:MAG: hypothetical protein NVS2B9_04320 [Myxococcales bacterium]
MTRARQKLVAGALAAVAALAFVATPPLHGEEHVREAQAAQIDRAAAFDRVFDIVFSGKASGRRTELARALARVLDEPGAAHLHLPGDRPHQHGEPGVPGHSHGPGNHGAGSLQHFAAALHVAPARPPLPQPAPIVLATAKPRDASFVNRTSWLVEQSQGPPRS